MKSWYLIHTKPRQEILAGEHLERQGYRVYLPLALNIRRRKGKTAEVTEAMFPRYLFIHLSNETDDWGPIHSTTGVTTLVRFGQIPARVPDALIKDLRNRENEKGVHILPVHEFHSGDSIKITEGVLEGYEGVYQARTGKDRVTLLMKIAQKNIKLTLSANKIAPL